MGWRLKLCGTMHCCLYFIIIYKSNCAHTFTRTEGFCNYYIPVEPKREGKLTMLLDKRQSQDVIIIADSTKGDVPEPVK